MERAVPHVHGHEQLSCTFFPLHPATLESAFPAHSVTREERRTAVVASAKLTTAEVEVWKIEPVELKQGRWQWKWRFFRTKSSVQKTKCFLNP